MASPVATLGSKFCFHGSNAWQPVLSLTKRRTLQRSEFYETNFIRIINPLQDEITNPAQQKVQQRTKRTRVSQRDSFGTMPASSAFQASSPKGEEKWMQSVSAMKN